MTLATDEAGGHVHPSLGVRQQTRNQATSEIRYPQTGVYHADRSATRTHKFGTIAIVKIASQLETHF
jgi:hypothetical protein